MSGSIEKSKETEMFIDVSSIQEASLSQVYTLKHLRVLNKGPQVEI